MHFRLGIDAERVRNAIDVIEIGNHFHRVKNVTIGKTVPTQGFQVLRADGGRRASHKFRKLAQRFLARQEFGEAVIVLDVLGEFRIFAVLTEILSVRFNSIKAVVRPRNHRPQHLALGAGQARLAVHGG